MANALRAKIAKLEQKAGPAGFGMLPRRTIVCHVRFGHSEEDSDNLLAEAGLDDGKHSDFVVCLVHPKHSEPANHKPKLISVDRMPYEQFIAQ